MTKITLTNFLCLIASLLIYHNSFTQCQSLQKYRNIQQEVQKKLGHIPPDVISESFFLKQFDRDKNQLQRQKNKFEQAYSAYSEDVKKFKQEKINHLDVKSKLQSKIDVLEMELSKLNENQNTKSEDDDRIKKREIKSAISDLKTEAKTLDEKYQAFIVQNMQYLETGSQETTEDLEDISSYIKELKDKVTKFEENFKVISGYSNRYETTKQDFESQIKNIKDSLYSKNTKISACENDWLKKQIYLFKGEHKDVEDLYKTYKHYEPIVWVLHLDLDKFYKKETSKIAALDTEASRDE